MRRTNDDPFDPTLRRKPDAGGAAMNVPDDFLTELVSAIDSVRPPDQLMNVPDEFLTELVACLHSFGDIALFDNWHVALDEEPPPEWSPVKTAELRKRINAMGPLLYRIRTEYPALYPKGDQ
jgi:hypothetical protein